ncbi:hypothetical protein FOPG_19480 [Fusarium oxysporum f. sp. conglutinans race 2 54008]|uniref:Uncharacterized protein n=1 Tax=Fusarium oxysporum f. sp. conglutinans race 2 54008 TaxID=1089457 RepID=X0GWN5_FUSOX|nr:hypothetical protein FOPG_19480 [Fusarium oxysporum f. sp. conglutinans race 2 54008]
MRRARAPWLPSLVHSQTSWLRKVFALTQLLPGRCGRHLWPQA